jgi:hypothetical protein
MTTPTQPDYGLDIAEPLASSPMSEASRRPETGNLPGLAGCDEDPLNANPQPSRLLDAWRPSDRRRLGLLSTRSYDNAAMTMPTDMWSYQRLFIDQRRDGANPFAVKPSLP